MQFIIIIAIVYFVVKSMKKKEEERKKAEAERRRAAFDMPPQPEPAPEYAYRPPTPASPFAQVREMMEEETYFAPDSDSEGVSVEGMSSFSEYSGQSEYDAVSEEGRGASIFSGEGGDARLFYEPAPPILSEPAAGRALPAALGGDNLVWGIIMSEVLGKPKALRR